MISSRQFTLLVAIGALSLLLALANALMVLDNRSRQADVSARQGYLQGTVQLENLQREIVKALADLAVKSNDRRLLDVLAAQGFNVSVNPPSADPASTAPVKK